MFIGALLVFGLFSYSRIGVDMFPNVEIPFASVVTIYPGADPKTVEKEVSEKIEEAVSTISGVRTLRSISVENVSQVMIEFELDVEVDKAVQDVRDKIGSVIPLLPADVETPKVEKFDIGSAPILTLVVGGPGAVDEVTRFARKRVKERIQSIRGVGSVDIVGGQEREIKVWIDPGKLEAMGLAVTDVVQALAANNIKYPGGSLTSGSTEFAVKVDGEFKNLKEIEDLKIREMKGRGIRVRDVARVEDGLEERRTAARLDGVSAVTLLVRKQSGTNTVEVGDAVKKMLAEVRQGFPENWTVVVARDNTTNIKTSINHVQFDILFGGLLAVVIVFLFLRNLRSTIIIGLALPTSVVGTFTFVHAMGFTFNWMTLLALSLSIGILVDDAIVMLENIYRHMEEGKPPLQAASEGAKEIGFAVMATTMSLVAVFVPVAFMQGIVGKFFYEFGLTVAIAVLLSLVVSFTLTPMLCSRFLGETKSNWLYRLFERVLDGLDAGYSRIIGWAVRHRLVTVIIALLAFGSVVPIVGALGKEFMPVSDMGEFNVTMRMPTGTTLTETERVARSIAKKLRHHDHAVKSTVMTIGSDAQKKQNLAKVYVKMVDKDKRTVSQGAFMGSVREEFSDLKEAIVAVEDIDIVGGDSGMRMSPIQFAVRGGDLEQLDRVTKKVAAVLAKTPGFVDLETSFEGGKPEVQVRVERDKAANLGVMTAQVGQTVRTLVGGVEASKYREGGEDYPIRVRLEQSQRRSASQISGLKVRAMSNKLISLANLAGIEMGTGPTQIDRQARQRQITIFSNLESSLALGRATEIVDAVAEKIVPKELVKGYEGDAKMMEESARHMGISLLLAIIMIYMVLASQFESFLHPLTIMVSLPLSLVGAVGGLLIAGQTLSIISGIGIIMLMGVVTKNAILLVDYTNTLRRRDGMDRTAAILKACPTRLRPILMTSAATVFGMLPVALSTGLGSEGRAPMATCVIGGLIMSTLLTLVVVPIVYTILDDIGQFFSRKRA